MGNAPHLDIALKYARDTFDDHGIEELQRLGARRFLDDLDAGRWDFKTALPEFCISIMTGLFTFSKGERLDGSPLSSTGSGACRRQQSSGRSRTAGPSRAFP